MTHWPFQDLLKPEGNVQLAVFSTAAVFLQSHSLEIPSQRETLWAAMWNRDETRRHSEIKEWKTFLSMLWKVNTIKEHLIRPNCLFILHCGQDHYQTERTGQDRETRVRKTDGSLALSEAVIKRTWKGIVLMEDYQHCFCYSMLIFGFIRHDVSIWFDKNKPTNFFSYDWKFYLLQPWQLQNQDYISKKLYTFVFGGI